MKSTFTATSEITDDRRYGAFIFLAFELFHEFLQIDDVPLMIPLADNTGTVRGRHSKLQDPFLSLD